MNVDAFRISWIAQQAVATPILQFGVGVSTRNFKKAVDRNRIKRLIKENWRVQKNPVWDMVSENRIELYVFAIFTGKELPDYNTVYNMMSKSIEKLKGVLKK
jgi:ribonuclease P protein component